MPPLISVLMPVYNAAAYLEEAVDSILAQTFRDFEFIIFNDGSADRSSEILRSYDDPRIVLIDNKENQGYVPLLNQGISMARGKYIARMDADDVAAPERFARQVAYMEAHPDCVVCGTHFTILGKGEAVCLPVTDELIKLRLLYITPFCHPTVFLRTEVLRQHELSYIKEHTPAEDHELWVKLSRLGTFHNLEEVLLHYRVHDNNISTKERTPLQVQNQEDARKQYITEFFSQAAAASGHTDCLYALFFQDTGWTVASLQQTGDLIAEILSGTYTYPVGTQSVHELLSERFFYRCTTSTALGMPAYRLAAGYSFVQMAPVNRLKLLVKSILKFKS